MCEAPICNCHHKMPATVLKLDVGKRYLTRNNTRVKVLFYNEGRYIGQAQDTRKYYEFHSNGLSVDQAVFSDLVSEYKEPEYVWFGLYQRESKIYYNTRDWYKHIKTSGVGNRIIGVYKVDLTTGGIEQDLGKDLWVNNQI